MSKSAIVVSKFAAEAQEEELKLKPRIGVAPAVPTVTLATVFASLQVNNIFDYSRLVGSSHQPAYLNPGIGKYIWFACVASSDADGVIFKTSGGQQEWAGALSSGNKVVGSPPEIPTVTYATYTDSDGVVWHLYRQNTSATAASFWTA